MPTYSEIEHLLRRTEFVARPWRVVELAAKPSLAAAVDDVMAVPADPGTATFSAAHNWVQGEQYSYYWFNRMAHDSPRPFQERMALFWHGHFCTSLKKIELMEPLRQQLDLFRREGLSNLRSLAIKMSTQPAMLRYLDNDRNFKNSPNQNFARELMELFLLGVGNYTEADVEASTAAWTGHSDVWETGQYLWRGDEHDGSEKAFLGRTINGATQPDPKKHGQQTIEVILSNGVVPAAASSNKGRPTREVAAEFVTRKMWRFFAGTEPPGAVVAALRDVAIANDFEIRPWVKALLLRPEFYSTEVRRGLVKPPADLMVTYLFATGLRAEQVVPLWWLEGMGQRPLCPPDVSGWKHNEVFVNAGSMAQRALAARYFMWTSMAGYWAGDGLLHLGGGAMSRAEIEAMAGQPEHFVDQLLARTFITYLSDQSKQVLYDHARATPWYERHEMLALVLLAPEVHLG